MKCEQSRELCDLFLSDQLQSETNIELQKHLTKCDLCDTYFAERRSAIVAVRSAVLNTAAFKIDDAFARRLSDELRTSLVTETSPSWFSFVFWRAAPAVAFASILLVSGLVFVAPNALDGVKNLLYSGSTVSAFYDFAVADHEYCTVGEMDYWLAKGPINAGIEAQNAAVVESALRNVFTTVEVLSEHDCEFQGRTISHIVLRMNDQLVSVYIDKDFYHDPRITSPSVRTSSISGYNVASFDTQQASAAVVSALGKDQNAKIAATIARHSSRDV